MDDSEIVESMLLLSITLILIFVFLIKTGEYLDSKNKYK